MATSSSIIKAYQILEIPVNSSECEVRTAYKRLALKLHPDKNIGNPNAAANFRLISEAYSSIMLSLKNKGNAKRSPYQSYAEERDDDEDEEDDENDEDDDDEYDDEASRTCTLASRSEPGGRSKLTRAHEVDVPSPAGSALFPVA